MRRRALEQLLTGLVLLVFVVGAFIHYAQRDSATLREGVRVPGVVVDRVHTHWFNFMSDGRIVVAYDLNGRHAESAIWLDNYLSDYRIGQAVTVVVRGSHVRTTREPNDPAPFGCGLVFVGLLGLGLLVNGLLRLRPPVGAAPPTSAVLARIPLRTFRAAPRRALIDVTATGLSIFLPAFFGARRLEIPIRDVAVECLTAEEPEAGSEYDDEDYYFKDALRIARFPTASVLRDGNLLLVFREPLRVPRLRWLMVFNSNSDLPFGWRESRSVEGARIDGAVLRAADVKDACAQLGRAGVEQTQDGVAWLAKHRELETDPAEQALIEVEEEREARIFWLRGLLWGGGWVLLVISQWRDDFRFLGAAAALLVAAGLLSMWRRRQRR